MLRVVNLQHIIETQLAQDESLEIPFGLSVPKGRVAMKTGVPKDPPVLDD